MIHKCKCEYDLNWDCMRSVVVTVILVFGVLTQLKGTRGKYGEGVIRLILSFLPHKDYHVLYNVRFNIGRKICQIDHLVVSPYGIFVIETKNYLGVTYDIVNSPMLRRSALRAGGDVYKDGTRHYKLGEFAIVGEATVLAMRTTLHNL